MLRVSQVDVWKSVFHQPAVNISYVWPAEFLQHPYNLSL